jgi:hypothetical protein
MIRMMVMIMLLLMIIIIMMIMMMMAMMMMITKNAIMAIMIMMMSVLVNDTEAIVRVRGRACVCVRECAGAFMSGLLLECLLRELECMLTRVIRDGSTAMHWAVQHGQPASIEALVQMKADVTICDECACLDACCGCKS